MHSVNFLRCQIQGLSYLPGWGGGGGVGGDPTKMVGGTGRLT